MFVNPVFTKRQVFPLSQSRPCASPRARTDLAPRTSPPSQDRRAQPGRVGSHPVVPRRARQGESRPPGALHMGDKRCRAVEQHELVAQRSVPAPFLPIDDHPRLRLASRLCMLTSRRPLPPLSPRPSPPSRPPATPLTPLDPLLPLLPLSHPRLRRHRSCGPPRRLPWRQARLEPRRGRQEQARGARAAKVARGLAHLFELYESRSCAG